ncbi:MAG: hypothetical protein HY714_01800 [Candidatus Omnitrophica bacterium]|nr:hypothetical protein [Candidatus Omnitrophota bacterium]
MNLTRAIIFLFLPLFFLPARLRAEPAKELRVEGIVYDDSGEGNSVAVVDGNFLRRGDTYEGFKILEVKTDRVRAAAEDGTEKVFRILGGGRKGGTASNAPTGANSRVAAPASPDDAPIQQAVRKFRQLLSGGSREGEEPGRPGSGISDSLTGLFGLAFEIRAFLDVRSVYVAYGAFYLKEGRPPKDFGELAQSRLLPKDFADGANGPYEFTMAGTAERFAIEARPVNAKVPLKYFYVDEDGVVRVAKGRPADSESPSVSASNMLGWSL